MLNAGYWNMPEATAAAWRNGWFHTGDGFQYDEDGFFYFVDRIKDALRRRGENISSFEVEAIVNQHPAVRECAAIAVPSELTEDDVKIVVAKEPDSALDAEALFEFLVERMPKFMLPRYIEFLDELPRVQTTLKVKKAELRREAVNANTWDAEARPVNDAR
jgi:crotonobetaine/carnitine-CoA ligase